MLQFHTNIDRNGSQNMKMKEKLKKIIFPHKLLIFLLCNISAVGLIWVFISGIEKQPIAFGVYTLSAFTLVTVCARIPGIVKWWKAKLYENKYTNMYLSDPDLRMRISMHMSLLIAFAFASFKVILGFVYNSKWFFAMAGYNMILSLMRFILVHQLRKKDLSEYQEKVLRLQSYRACGWLMMVLNVAVSVLMFMVIVQKQTIQYSMIVAIGLAAFTFFCFTRAIINFIKYRKHNNPIYAAVKRIDMVKAIVSVFTLQVAMLTTFQGQGEELDVRFLNICTSIVVVVAINTIGALMIAGAKGDFRQLENVEV